MQLSQKKEKKSKVNPLPLTLFIFLKMCTVCKSANIEEEGGSRQCQQLIKSLLGNFYENAPCKQYLLHKHNIIMTHRSYYHTAIHSLGKKDMKLRENRCMSQSISIIAQSIEKLLYEKKVKIACPFFLASEESITLP